MLNRIQCKSPVLNLSVLAFLVLVGSVTVSVRSQDATAEKVYKARCAMCHGDDLKAETKAGKMTKTPDLTVESNWKEERTQEAVEKITREGLGKMPAFESKLSAEEIQVVAAYTLKLAGIDE